MRGDGVTGSEFAAGVDGIDESGLTADGIVIATIEDLAEFLLFACEGLLLLETEGQHVIGGGRKVFTFLLSEGFQLGLARSGNWNPLHSETLPKGRPKIHECQAVTWYLRERQADSLKW